MRPKARTANVCTLKTKKNTTERETILYSIHEHTSNKHAFNMHSKQYERKNHEAGIGSYGHLAKKRNNSPKRRYKQRKILTQFLMMLIAQG